MMVSLVGNVGSVRTFTGEDGRKTVVFSVAVDQRAAATGSDGAKQAPIWYHFRVTGPLAETLSQYLSKGRLVYVAGTSPRLRTYEVERSLNIQGVGVVKFKDVRQETEYYVSDFRFLDAPAAQLEAQLVAPATTTQTSQVQHVAQVQQAAQAQIATPVQQTASQVTPQVASHAAQPLPDDLPF